MAGLADFSADDIISSDDTTNPNVTLAGPGTPVMSNLATAGDVDTSVEQAPGASGELPLDSAVIENAMSGVKAEAPKAAAADDETSLEKPTKKVSPAQERIMRLIDERNHAQAALARMAEQTQAIQQQMAEQYAQAQKQQLDLEQRRIEQVERARREEEIRGLSEVEQARRKFLAEAEERAAAKLSPELAAMKAELATIKAEREAAVKAAEDNQRLQYFKHQADTVLDTVLLKDYSPEEQKALRNGMEEMLYSFSGAFGVDPVRAAPVFKDFLARYSKAEMAKLSRTSGVKVAESRKAPITVAPARSSARPAGNVPTLAQLRKGTADGRSFDNHVQWYAARQPALLP